VTALGEEAEKTRRGLCDRVGGGDADNVEAFRVSLGDQPGLQLSGIVQKSRSA
jgi:hypothetical protein